EGWLKTSGVEVGDHLVVDPSATVPFYGDETIFVNAIGASPVVESLAQAKLPVILPLARSVKLGPLPPGMDGQTLLQTSGEGWGERDLANLRGVAKEATDTAGRVPVAVAIAAKQEKAKPALEAEELDAAEPSEGASPASAAAS